MRVVWNHSCFLYFIPWLVAVFVCFFIYMLLKYLCSKLIKPLLDLNLASDGSIFMINSYTSWNTFVGYLFYWADFSSYPTFSNCEDIPEIRLPVRTEHSTMEEILTSFIEAITDYYAWLGNEMYEGYTPNEDEVEEILQAYLCSRQ